MNKIQTVRGTHDLFGSTKRKHRHIVETAWDILSKAGYDWMDTPIFESIHVFKRQLGETSDIVNKEMYSFDDRGGDRITLRPEGTAPVVRAFLQNAMTQNLPQKFFYAGPMFRYERPQKGRQRQFHQIGCEFFGPSSPLIDAEMIMLSSLVLGHLLPTNQHHYTLHINSLGDRESRAHYRDALVAYLSRYRDELSEDSQRRLDENPLRILDSKAACDQEIIQNAPILSDHFNETSKTHFTTVLEKLDALGIAYTLDHKLVRGLDYYDHTVFEWISHDLGSQGTILAGGRADHITEQMGSKQPVPLVGWAAGIERLALLLDQSKDDQDRFAMPKTDYFIVCLDDDIACEDIMLIMQKDFIARGHSCQLCYQRNLKKALKKADQANAQHVVIINNQSPTSQNVELKNMETGTQTVLDIGHLLS